MSINKLLLHLALETSNEKEVFLEVKPVSGYVVVGAPSYLKQQLETIKELPSPIELIKASNLMGILEVAYAAIEESIKLYLEIKDEVISFHISSKEGPIIMLKLAGAGSEEWTNIKGEPLHHESNNPLATAIKASSFIQSAMLSNSDFMVALAHALGTAYATDQPVIISAQGSNLTYKSKFPCDVLHILTPQVLQNVEYLINNKGYTNLTAKRTGDLLILIDQFSNRVIASIDLKDEDNPVYKHIWYTGTLVGTSAFDFISSITNRNKLDKTYTFKNIPESSELPFMEVPYVCE